MCLYMWVWWDILPQGLHTHKCDDGLLYLWNIVAMSIWEEQFVGDDGKSLGMEKVSPIEERSYNVGSNKEPNVHIN